jgi:diacylglycerol kinase family enzyme
VADLWRAGGWQVDVQPTQRPGHAVELARTAAAAGYQVVLAAGGDGTLGDVAHGLAGSATALAPLPVGTANSLARELLLPRPTLLDRNRLLQTAVQLLNGRLQHIDLGWVSQVGGENGRHWLLWVGVGADGHLVEQIEPRPQWSKKLGKLGYALQALGQVWRLPRQAMVVSIDGRSVSGRFLLVLLSNCRRYAGGELVMNRQAQLDDGTFDIWLLHGHGLARALRYLWRIRWQGEAKGEGVERLNGRCVTIHATPTAAIQTDGEPTGQTPIQCELRPNALWLLVPQTTPTDLFAHPGRPLLAE